MMNKNFKVDEVVVCDFGLNRGKELIITKITPDGYLLKAIQVDERIYFYNDRTLQKKA